MNLPGRQYIPSNGTEGAVFFYNHCERCARDSEISGQPGNKECPIIAASFRGQAIQWRELENGDTFCTEFLFRSE